MIKSFRHKGLRLLYQREDASGVRADHVARLRRLLASLEVAQAPANMERPGYRLHLLRGSERIGQLVSGVPLRWYRRGTCRLSGLPLGR